jgi:hypothetical protein
MMTPGLAKSVSCFLLTSTSFFRGSMSRASGVPATQSIGIGGGSNIAWYVGICWMKDCELLMPHL